MHIVVAIHPTFCNIVLKNSWQISAESFGNSLKKEDKNPAVSQRQKFKK